MAFVVDENGLVIVRIVMNDPTEIAIPTVKRISNIFFLIIYLSIAGEGKIEK